jgi:hypothetical protein
MLLLLAPFAIPMAESPLELISAEDVVVLEPLFTTKWI